MRPTRLRLILGATVAAALVLAIWWLGGEDGSGDQWTRVERGTLRLEVPITGRIQAQRVTTYGPPQISRVWRYRIAYIAPEGSEVEAGDPVLRFDTSELEQRLAGRESDRSTVGARYMERKKAFEARLGEQDLALEEARVQARKAEVAANVPEDIVARSELEKATIDLDLARREVEYRRQHKDYLEGRAEAELAGLEEHWKRAVAEVEEIERAIELMTVEARYPGIVMHKANRRGEKKKVGDTAWRGEILLEIPELDAMQVAAEVDEANSGRLEVGQPAELRLDAHPDIVLAARLERIQQTVEPRSRRDPRKIVRLELSLARSDPRFVRPGMRVQGTLLQEERVEVPVLPVAAVLPGRPEPTVIVRTLLGRRERHVELGLRSGDRVEVRAGVEVGDRVLVSG